MNLTFDPRSAAFLAQKTAGLIQSGRELSSFGEMDPELAGECGVELSSLEARTILSGGAPQRLYGAATEAARTGRVLQVPHVDVDAVERLEAVVAMGSSKIALKLAALDVQSGQEPVARIGTLLGVATGAVGFIRSIL